MSHIAKHCVTLLRTVIASLGVALFVPGICMGEPYELPDAGLILSLSSEWSQVPQPELTAITQQAKAKAPKMNISSYAYGFRKASENSWGSLLIAVRARRITDATLDEMPKANDVSGYAINTEQKSGGLLRGFRMGDSRYDTGRKILWMTMSAADLMGGGGMKGVSATFIRKAQEIQLSGYCDEASYESFCREFEGIVRSARKTSQEPQ